MVSRVKISIVTVCLNASDTIAKTIESVLCQTYADWEYVIMDGQSVDGTLEIVHKVTDSYKNSSVIKVFSGKDEGLYQAMNKAIDVCEGDYILFLNSGDVFISCETIAEAAARIAEINVNKPDDMVELAYGNVVRICEDGTKLEKYPGKHAVFKLLMMGRMPCHQVIFTRADIMRKYRFDESYRICADFDFLVRCMRGRVRMHYIDTDISKVDCVAGISSQKFNLSQMREEDDKSIKKNYPLYYTLMRPVKWVVRKMKR